MNDALPPPLTPARSDLRDFGFMPLEIVRFRGSGLIAESSAEGALAAIMLWTAAWHETPAASLVDNDRVLANAAGFGRSVTAWLEVKDEALRGWIKCSDGRLYHPIVARLANEAWKSKVEQRWRTEVGRRRKWNERHPEEPNLAIPSFEAFAAHYPDDCPDDRTAMSQGQLSLVARTEAECPEDLPSKGQGEEQGQGQGDSTTPPKPPEPDPPRPPDKRDLLSLTQEITQAAGVSIIKPSAVARELDIVKRWVEAGIAIDDTVLPTIRKKVGDMRPDETVGSLAFFDALILKAHNRTNGSTKARRPAGPGASVNDRDDDDPRVASFRSHLRGIVGPQTYGAWLKPGTTAIHVNGETTTINAASRFLADWISSNLSDKLRESAAAAGVPPEIRIVAS